MLFLGFITGIVIVAAVAVRLSNTDQPPVEVPTALALGTPLVSAIDSATCEDREIGAQYAMVCADSQLLNTDDPTACDGFGGPYQIIVCPDPSQMSAGDTRPTIAASGGGVVLPMPVTVTATVPSDLAPTAGAPSIPTAIPTGPIEVEPLPEAPSESTPTPPIPDVVPTALPDNTQDTSLATSTAPPIGEATIAPSPTTQLVQDTPVPGAATVTPTVSGLTPAPTVTMTPTVHATSTLTPTIGPSPTPTGPLTLPDTGLVLSGVGQQTTAGLVLTSSRLLMTQVAYNGLGTLTLALRPANDSASQQLLQATGLPEASSVVDIPAAGIYVIDVSAPAASAWTLNVSQPVPPADTPYTSPELPLTGRGDQATRYVRLYRRVTAMTFAHAGTGNLIVTLFDAEIGRRVGSSFVQSGSAPQTQTISIDREGIYIFDVATSDAFTITIR